VDAAWAKIAYVPHAYRMNILLAEDNSDDVVLLEHAFKKAGVTSPLTAVTDGLEALDYLKGEGAFADRAAYPFPDVLLLDLNMPRKNGFEVLAWVRRDASCCRLMVHILTASPRESDAERAYALGANSYVVKPSRFDELVRFVGALGKWHEFVTLARPPAEEEVRSVGAGVSSHQP
jgi:CheY-like chemotaxis protein